MDKPEPNPEAQLCLPPGVRLPPSPPAWLRALMGDWDASTGHDVTRFLARDPEVSLDAAIYSPWEKAYTEVPKSNAEYEQRRSRSGGRSIWETGSQFLSTRDLCDPGLQCLPDRLWQLCCIAATAAASAEYQMGHLIVLAMRAPFLSEAAATDGEWTPEAPEHYQEEIWNALQCLECEGLLSRLLSNRTAIADAVDGHWEWWLQDTV